MLVCLWLLILVDVICPYMLRDKLLSYVLCFHMHSTCQGQLSRSGVVGVLLCLSVFMCCCFNAILLPRTAVENELVWPTSNIPSLMLKHAVRDKSWSPRLTCIIQPDSQYGALSIVFFFFFKGVQLWCPLYLWTQSCVAVASRFPAVWVKDNLGFLKYFACALRYQNTF